jgi:RNA-directed DNA polymerase
MVNMPSGNFLQKSDDFEEFNQAYEVFEDLTNSYKKELEDLQHKIEGSTKPLVITEGKTDWKHLKKALEKLSNEYPDLDIEFLEYEDDIKMGSSALNGMIQGLQKVPHDRKIICVFDRDEKNIMDKYGVEDFNNHGNNIYSLCIPKISEVKDKISIEYYYNEDEIKTLDENERRLFLGTEFHAKSGNSKCGNYQLQDKNKANKQIVIDNAVFKSDDPEWDTSIALTKNDFAENILNDVAGFDEFNFDKYKLIFDIIKDIVKGE